MARFVRSRYATVTSFAAIILVVESASRLIAPSLPVDPGKWPRIEIASKLDQMQDYVEKGRDVDVLFVGSSMMAGGVDAIEFTRASGRSGYNAAFAGPSIRTVTPWVLDVVEPMLSPEVVVLGVATRELNDNAPKNIRMWESFMASPGYKQTKGSVASRLEGDLEKVSYFMRYRRALREPTTLFETSAEDERALAEAELRQVIGPRGTRQEDPITYRRAQKQIQQLYDRTLIDFSLGGEEYDALVRLATELEEREVQLVLLDMPVASDYWEAHEDPITERSTYRALLDRFVDQHEVTLIDAEDAFPTNEAFRDVMHLDIEGRRAMAAALAQRWDEITEGAATWALDCTAEAEPTCRLSR